MLTNEDSCDGHSLNPPVNHAAPDNTMKDSIEERRDGPSEQPDDKDASANYSLNSLATSQFPDTAGDFPVEHLPSAMLANSSNVILDSGKKSHLPSNNESKNESSMSFSSDPRDKIWSLIDSVGSEEFGSQPFVDSMSQNISFTGIPIEKFYYNECIHETLFLFRRSAVAAAEASHYWCQFQLQLSPSFDYISWCSHIGAYAKPSADDQLKPLLWSECA